jgi:hypothetical protein
MESRKKRNLTPQDRKRRSDLMKKLNQSGRCSPLYGKYWGGRPRSSQGETAAQALERRKREFEVASNAVGEARLTVTVELQQTAERVAPKDTQEQIARAFNRGRGTGYRSDGWRV